MRIEVENFSDFEVVLKRITKSRIKNKNKREPIENLMRKVFQIGFNCGKNGKSTVEIDNEV